MPGSGGRTSSEPRTVAPLGPGARSGTTSMACEIVVPVETEAAELRKAADAVLAGATLGIGRTGPPRACRSPPPRVDPFTVTAHGGPGPNPRVAGHSTHHG